MQNHPNQDQSAGEENRRDSASPERRSKLEGFDTKKNRPGSTPRPGPGAVPPVDPVPDAGMAKPGGERKERKRFTQPLSEPERALAKDAAAQARQLKRKHRALYTTDPRRFRKIVRLAQSVVFRQNQDRSPTKKLPGVSLILPVARNGVNAPRSATIAPNGPVLAPGPPGPLPGLDEFDEFELDESEEVDEPERED